MQLILVMTEIMHTDGLALALRQRTLLDELHLRCEENLILQGTLDILGHPLNLGIDICLQAIELNLYGHDIIVVDGLEGDQVVAAQAWILHENLLHLHREDIDTLDDEHIISTTLDAVDTTVGTSALTFTWQNTGKVACTIS